MNYRTGKRYAALFLCLSLPLVNGCSTFLVDIIEEGASDKALALLDEGEDPNGLGACDTPLYTAAKKNDQIVIQALLKKGADPKLRSKECAYRDMFGRYKAGNRSPLDSVKSLEVAKILLDAGADPRWGGFEERGNSVANWTPLYVAILADRYEIARLLVEKGARVNQYSDSDGSNIFLRLLSGKKDAKAQALRTYLIAKGAKELPLAQASKLIMGTEAYTTYRHIPSGQTTTLSPEIASLIRKSPEQVIPLTLSAEEGKYYHYSEFEWTDNKQNLHEWLVLLRASLGLVRSRK